MGSKAASPRKKFSMQKSAAKIRGVEWCLTFEEWWQVWEASGQWKNRGCRRGQFVMARNGDTGPYALGNVSIVEAGENAAAGLSGRTWKWGEGNIHRPARVKQRKATKLAKPVADSVAPARAEIPHVVHVPLAPLAPPAKAPSPRVAPRVDRVGPTSRPVVLRARPPLVVEPLWRSVFRRLWNAVA